MLGVEAVGVPDAQATALTTALRDALQKRPGVQQMPGKDFVEMRFLFGCTDEATLAPCMVQAGKTLVADKLVLATLTAGAGKESGTTAVQLRLLDVASGKFVREVRESVPAGALGAGAIDATGERWLAQLLGEAVVAAPQQAVVKEVPPVEKAPAPASRGKGLMIVGAAALGLAVVAAGGAIFTWRHYLGMQDDTTNTLTAIRDQNPDYYNAHAQFFGAPGCDLPAPAPTRGPTAAYHQQCSDGRSWAAATTGLWVGAGVLAAGGATAMVLGLRQGRQAERTERTGSPPSRLVVVPSLSPGGGGLSLTYTF